MAKNMVKKENPGMELGVRDMDAEARSKNLEKGAAYEAPLKNNAMREQPHLGAMPRAGQGKF